VFYRKEDEERWKTLSTPPSPMVTMEGLAKGETYFFKVRALSGVRRSAFTDEIKCRIGEGKRNPVLEELVRVLKAEPWILFRILHLILYYHVTTSFC
jgi:hypothetical protein